MAQPHFICLGAQKAGTRWVYDQFSAHDAFWRAPIKELTYFDRGVSRMNRKRAEHRLAWRIKKRAQGVAGHSTEIAFLERFLAIQTGDAPLEIGPYRQLFEGLPAPSFDCTPGYSRLGQGSIRAMAHGLPDTRFFMILRDPAERLWSQAQMHARLGRQAYNPTDSLANLQRFVSRESVQRFSFLAETIALWQHEAGDAFRVLSFDQLRDKPLAFRESLARFLRVDPNGFGRAAQENRKSTRPGRASVPPDIQAWMASYFRHEYEALAQMLPFAGVWHDRNIIRLDQQLPGWWAQPAGAPASAPAPWRQAKG